MTRQMPAHDVIGDGKEAMVWALGAFDSRFLANTRHPFIAAGRGVAGFARFTTLKSPGVDIIPATK